MKIEPFTARLYPLLIIILWLPILANAQSPQQLIQAIQKVMLERYVYLDKAQEINTHLDRLLQDGYFDAFAEPSDLAEVLTEQMRKISKDNHLSIVAPRLIVPEKKTEAPDPLDRLERYTPSMVNGYQYYDQNVGYFDMRYFGGGAANLGQIDEVMQKLIKADAIIIDLRYSLGGSPSTVQYLCSYFFDQDILLSSIYSRHNDETREYRTVAVNGQKRPRVPVFILTSDRSFSAAEDFPYTMQSHQRATIVGEVTRGGAHPTRSHDLPGGFRARIPFARSINPITQSNWEGIGVIPNEEVSEDQALAAAKKLAEAAAVEYRVATFTPLITALDAIINAGPTIAEEQAIHQHLSQLAANQIVGENDINRFGYNYLLASKKQAALLIFKTNTLLYPNSANAFDSYAEVLAELGQTEQALKNYKKAVTLAKAQNHRNLEAFQQNLAAFEQKKP